MVCGSSRMLPDTAPPTTTRRRTNGRKKPLHDRRDGEDRAT